MQTGDARLADGDLRHKEKEPTRSVGSQDPAGLHHRLVSSIGRTSTRRLNKTVKFLIVVTPVVIRVRPVDNVASLDMGDDREVVVRMGVNDIEPTGGKFQLVGDDVDANLGKLRGHHPGRCSRVGQCGSTEPESKAVAIPGVSKQFSCPGRIMWPGMRQVGIPGVSGRNHRPDESSLPVPDDVKQTLPVNRHEDGLTHPPV